jgi:hypothetical protein
VWSLGLLQVPFLFLTVLYLLSIWLWRVVAVVVMVLLLSGVEAGVLVAC